MKKAPLFEISVTSVEHGEWQGTVTFPASGEQLPFGSLREQMKVGTRGMSQPERTGD